MAKHFDPYRESLIGGRVRVYLRTVSPVSFGAFRRIDAPGRPIAFTIKHNDGLGLRSVDNADILDGMDVPTELSIRRQRIEAIKEAKAEIERRAAELYDIWALDICDIWGHTLVLH